MTFSIPAVLRPVAAGAVGCLMLVGSAGLATADPAANCTAADLARISAGVSSATADFLDARPDVNAFFTSLKGQDPETLAGNVESYLASNPEVKGALAAIRQPLADFETRCV